MSLPARTYLCSDCDFRQGVTGLWGVSEYVFPNNIRLPVQGCLGWCDECGGLAAVEILPEREGSAKIGTAGQELPVLPVRLPRCLICGSTRVMTPLVTTQEKSSESEEPGPPIFGGTVKEKRNEIGKRKPTRFIHPGCGGELLMSFEEGLRFALRPSIRLYTPNGDFIERVFTDRL